MKIKFEDNDDDIWFEYSANVSGNVLPLGKNGRINLSGLYLYGMYKNTIYDSYKLKLDLADDIKSYKKAYHEDEKSKYKEDLLYNDSLHHYSVSVALAATKECLDPKEKMNCYFACQFVGKHKKNCWVC